MSQLRAMQTEAVDRGTLQINVTSSVNAFPVERAEISISYTGVPESTQEKIETDSCKCKGNTEHTDETSRCERGRGSSIRYPRSYFIWRLSPEDRRGRDQAGDRDGGDCFKPCGCAGVYCGT